MPSKKGQGTKLTLFEIKRYQPAPRRWLEP